MHILIPITKFNFRLPAYLVHFLCLICNVHNFVRNRHFLTLKKANGSGSLFSILLFSLFKFIYLLDFLKFNSCETIYVHYFVTQGAGTSVFPPAFFRKRVEIEIPACRVQIVHYESRAGIRFPTRLAKSVCSKSKFSHVSKSSVRYMFGKEILVSCAFPSSLRSGVNVIRD